MISPRQITLAHVLHIEHLADIKQTVSILEQETRHRLTSHICSFVVVRDTFEAFELMAHKRFDCIIIDENVEFNAYEAVQTIRTLIPDIPILMILHSQITELNVALQESEAVGCTHILMSNYTNEEYCTALQNMLSMEQELFHSLQNVTHFPWEKNYIPPKQTQTASSSSFHHIPPSHDSHVHPSPPLPPPLPAALMQHPSMSPDLLVNAMQFFNAQRTAQQPQTQTQIQIPTQRQRHAQIYSEPEQPQQQQQPQGLQQEGNTHALAERTTVLHHIHRGDIPSSPEQNRDTITTEEEEVGEEDEEDDVRILEASHHTTFNEAMLIFNASDTSTTTV